MISKYIYPEDGIVDVPGEQSRASSETTASEWIGFINVKLLADTSGIENILSSLSKPIKEVKL